MIRAAAAGSPLGPAIVSAVAALAGVCIAQVIAWLLRRGEERRRRRAEIAGVLAPTLSLIAAATEQIRQGDEAQVAWYQQPAWRGLRDDRWPPLQTLLLVQAAQERGSSPPSFDDLAQRLQDLLSSHDGDAKATLAEWQGARRHVLELRDERLPDRA